MDFGKLRTIARIIRSSNFALITVDGQGADTYVKLDTDLERAILLAVTTKKVSEYQNEKLTEMAAEQGELHVLEVFRAVIDKLELEDVRQ